MRYVNLFAGLGGATEGLSRAGDEVIWALEPDPDAASALSASFRETRVHEDVNVHPRDVPYAEGTFIGQPSCPVPVAAAAALNILSVTQPRVVIMDCKNREFSFLCCHPWLRSKEYRALSREGSDVFLYLRKDVKILTSEFPFPLDVPDERTLSSVLEASPDESLRVPADRLARLSERNEKARGKGFNFRSKVLPPEAPLPRLGARFHKSPYDLLVDDGKGPRLLSPVECARIMGLRDSMVPACSRTKAYRLITQSTSPERVRLLSEELKVWI